MNFNPSLPLLVIAGLLVLAGVAAVVAAKGRRGAALRRLAMALLLIGVALRPNVGAVPIAGASVPVDVVILVDRTTSMVAEDWNGDQRRLAGVASDATPLMEVLAGARIKVVTFDNIAKDELPFMTDTDTVATILETVGFKESYHSAGSSISLAVPLAEEILAESQSEAPDRTRYLIYIGDGEQTVPEPPASFEPLRQYLDGALVLGYGTEQGGRMVLWEGSDNYVTDGRGQPALSRINEDNLRTIAEQLGGQYQHRTAPGPIDFEIELGQASASDSTRYTGGLEVYWVPGLGIAALLLWELWAMVPIIRQTGRELW